MIHCSAIKLSSISQDFEALLSDALINGFKRWVVGEIYIERSKSKVTLNDFESINIATLPDGEIVFAIDNVTNCLASIFSSVDDNQKELNHVLDKLNESIVKELSIDVSRFIAARQQVEVQNISRDKFEDYMKYSLQFNIKVENQCLNIMFFSGFFRRKVSAEEQIKVDLTSLIGEKLLPLEVRSQEFNVDISKIRGLKVGDNLKISEDMSSNFSIYSEQKLLVDVSLGKLGEKRAVIINSFGD